MAQCTLNLMSSVDVLDHVAMVVTPPDYSSLTVVGCRVAGYLFICDRQAIGRGMRHSRQPLQRPQDMPSELVASFNLGCCVHSNRLKGLDVYIYIYSFSAFQKLSEGNTQTFQSTSYPKIHVIVYVAQQTVHPQTMCHACA